MSETTLARRYERLLAIVGARASEFGDRPIASHWPFIGSQFSGTLIVGRALAGWDAEETGARWSTNAIPRHRQAEAASARRCSEARGVD